MAGFNEALLWEINGPYALIIRLYSGVDGRGVGWLSHNIKVKEAHIICGIKSNGEWGTSLKNHQFVFEI